MTGGINQGQGAGLTEQEVWVRAFCAYITSFNARSEGAVRCADDCLKQFRERFPESRGEQ